MTVLRRGFNVSLFPFSASRSHESRKGESSPLLGICRLLSRWLRLGSIYLQSRTHDSLSVVGSYRGSTSGCRWGLQLGIAITSMSCGSYGASGTWLRRPGSWPATGVCELLGVAMHNGYVLSLSDLSWLVMGLERVCDR